MKRSDYMVIEGLIFDKLSAYVCYIAANFILSKEITIPGMLTDSPRSEMYEQWSSDLFCYEKGTFNKLDNALSLAMHALYLNWRYRWKPLIILAIGIEGDFYIC
ncbi:MAG: hypothetical protein ABW168_09075 [Sedimenticola sp.]